MGFWRIPFSDEMIFNCSQCNEELDTAEGDFHAALAMIKNEGWSVEKHPDGWKHFCPECAESMYADSLSRGTRAK
jgi:hypothetical protein